MELASLAFFTSHSCICLYRAADSLAVVHMALLWVWGVRMCHPAVLYRIKYKPSNYIWWFLNPQSSVARATCAWSLCSHVRPFCVPAARSMSSDRRILARLRQFDTIWTIRSGLPERTGAWRWEVIRYSCTYGFIFNFVCISWSFTFNSKYMLCTLYRGSAGFRPRNWQLVVR